MSPSHVLEPTYATVRRRLITGAWHPGERLEAVRLADALGVSMTPVRDALNRLAGERLVSVAPGDGFHVPRYDETELRAVLVWHQALLATAVRLMRAPMAQTTIPHGHDGIGERSGLLFGTIAAIAAMPELDWAIANVSARLGPYRAREAQVLAGVDAELDAIEAGFVSGNRTRLRQALDHYHRRRFRYAAQLVHSARPVKPTD